MATLWPPCGHPVATPKSTRKGPKKVQVRSFSIGFGRGIVQKPKIARRKGTKGPKETFQKLCEVMGLRGYILFRCFNNETQQGREGPGRGLSPAGLVLGCVLGRVSAVFFVVRCAGCLAGSESCSKKCAEAILSNRKIFKVRIMPFSVVKSDFSEAHVCTRGYIPNLILDTACFSLSLKWSVRARAVPVCAVS